MALIAVSCLTVGGNCACLCTFLQVLGRFGVGAHMIPCMRVAQIYPEGQGGGMEIFMPDKDVRHHIAHKRVEPLVALLCAKL